MSPRFALTPSVEPLPPLPPPARPANPHSPLLRGHLPQTLRRPERVRRYDGDAVRAEGWDRVSAIAWGAGGAFSVLVGLVGLVGDGTELGEHWFALG